MLKGVVQFTNISDEDRKELVKMLLKKTILHYDGIQEEVELVGVNNNNNDLRATLNLQLDFMVIVPRYAIEKLKQGHAQIGINPTRKDTVPNIKSKETHATLDKLSKPGFDLSRYNRIYLHYNGTGRYEFCEIDGRLFISRLCDKKEAN